MVIPLVKVAMLPLLLTLLTYTLEGDAELTLS
jgi:hypothetical protein